MAQLRDKKTSEVIFEGTPVEVASMAQKVGFDEILFDGVSQEFDPSSVLKSFTEETESLKSIAKSDEDDLKESAAAKVKDNDELLLDVDGEKSNVLEALNFARSKLED